MQKYALLEYTPNIFHYFFQLFLRELAKALTQNHVAEHIFLSMGGLRAETIRELHIIISHAGAQGRRESICVRERLKNQFIKIIGKKDRYKR